MIKFNDSMWFHRTRVITKTKSSTLFRVIKQSSGRVFFRYLGVVLSRGPLSFPIPLNGLLTSEYPGIVEIRT